MWIDTQDIQGKKNGVILLQASSTDNLLSPCKVLAVVVSKLCAVVTHLSSLFMFT